jgi:hypothetical protein
MCSWHVKGQLYQWYHVKAFIQNHHVTPSCLWEHHIIGCTGHVPQILWQQEKQWVYTAIAQLVEQIWLAQRTSDWSPWQHLPTPTQTLIQENVCSNFTRNVCLSTPYTKPLSPLQPTEVALQWVWSTHLQDKIHSWVQTPTAWSLLHGTAPGGVIKGQMSLIPVFLCWWTFVSQMSLISADGQGLKWSWLTTCASVCNTLCEWVSQTYPRCCVNHFMVRTELCFDVTRY